MPYRSAGALGEYRTIMNLCRVLPDGLDCKLAVDAAIDSCNDIGATICCQLECSVVVCVLCALCAHIYLAGDLQLLQSLIAEN
jgi:hypothetical protein